MTKVRENAKDFYMVRGRVCLLICLRSTLWIFTWVHLPLCPGPSGFFSLIEIWVVGDGGHRDKNIKNIVKAILEQLSLYSMDVK